MRAISQPHIAFAFETPEVLARVIPNKPGDWQRSIGSDGQWTDATTPRTDRPVRFGVLLAHCPECGERNVRQSAVDGRVCATCEPWHR